MKLGHTLAVLAVVSLGPIALFAGDPNAASRKITGDAYRINSNGGRTGGVRTYSYVPRSPASGTVATNPQAAPQAAPQTARAMPPSTADVAQANDSQRRSTRTFSVQPNTTVQSQGTMSMRRTTSHRHGLNYSAGRKITGKYSY